MDYKNFRDFIEKTSLDEGIDIDRKTRTISFNPYHQNNVDTNDLLKPYLVYSEQKFGKVYSIFERKENKERTDGNPCVYAFKGINGWKFKNKSDRDELIRRIINASKLLSSKFDTLVMTPSTNSFNNEIFELVKKHTNFNSYINDMFYKLSASEVYDRYYDYDKLSKIIKDKHELQRVDSAISQALLDMMQGTNIFTYKLIPSSYRKYIDSSLKVVDKVELKYKDQINDKKVLILDDTVSSGKTLSESAFALNATFSPKSITFLTVFSPLENPKAGIHNDKVQILESNDYIDERI